MSAGYIKCAKTVGRIIVALKDGQLSTSQLMGVTGMSKQAVSRWIAALNDAHLVSVHRSDPNKRSGRPEHIIELMINNH